MEAMSLCKPSTPIHTKTSYASLPTSYLLFPTPWSKLCHGYSFCSFFIIIIFFFGPQFLTPQPIKIPFTKFIISLVAKNPFPVKIFNSIIKVKQIHRSLGFLPKLNIAIPSPASDSMEIDFSIIFGMLTCHLQNKNKERKKERNKELEKQFGI